MPGTSGGIIRSDSGTRMGAISDTRAGTIEEGSNVNDGLNPNR